MDILSLAEMLETIDQMINTLEHDENRFYVAIDLASQLRDQLSQVIALDVDS